jgi:hypothetical protein
MDLLYHILMMMMMMIDTCIWSIGRGENQVFREKHIPVRLCPPKI